MEYVGSFFVVVIFLLLMVFVMVGVAFLILLDLAWARWKVVAAQKNMTSTGGCRYSFVYS